MGNCIDGITKGTRQQSTALRKPKGQVTLHSFGAPTRAEAIRLALVLGNVDFVDGRSSDSCQLGTHSLSQEQHFGSLSILEVGAKRIVQPKAILRYVGKISRHNGSPLYPEDLLAAARVDSLLDAFDDLEILLAPAHSIEDPQARAQASRAVMVGEGADGARKLATLDLILRDNGGWAVHDAGLTVADLVYFAITNTLRSGIYNGLDASLLDNYKYIKMHSEKIASLPAVKAYYEDATRSNPSGCSS